MEFSLGPPSSHCMQTLSDLLLDLTPAETASLLPYWHVQHDVG